MIEYKQALEAAGYERLFPELKLDERKGYGKAPNSWINDRFLGSDVKLPRDGRKVLHSFRHNFKTALERAGVPECAMNQLVGHAHTGSGERETAPGYVHVRKVEDLRPYVDQLDFALPNVVPFEVNDALKAIEHALALKRSSARLPPRESGPTDPA